MRTFLTALFAALILGLALTVAPAVVVAQDAPTNDLERRIKLLRKKDPAARQRLRNALERFKQLDPEKKRELRRRAKKLGEERLAVLADRDVKKIKKKHAAIENEKQSIWRYIGEERLARLTSDERRYVEAHATRRFQAYMKRKLLGLAGGGALEDFQALAPDERRTAIRAAMKTVEQNLIAEQPAQYRERLSTLPTGKRARAVRELLRDYRTREIPRFVSFFDHAWLTPFLATSTELRSREVDRWKQRKRWFEVRSVLEHEVGISTEHLRMLRGLHADELARLRDVLGTVRDLPSDERRLRIEEEIRRLDGQSAADRERRKRRKKKNRDKPRRKKPE